MQGNVIIGIDLAGVEKTTRWALWKNKMISTHLLYKNQEILKHSTKLELTLIAIDAPLSLRGKTDLIGDEEGYIVVPTEREWGRLRL